MGSKSGGSRQGPQYLAIIRRIERTPGPHVRSSAQRARVVDAILGAGKHFSVEDLQAVLAERGERIGYSTVYRAVRLLAEHGVLSESHFGTDVTRYELTEGAATHHDHLICQRCGLIIEFEEPQIEALQSEIAQRHGYDLQSHVHQLYGWCARCAAEAG